MAIDRSEVRRRVRTITAWVACGAAAVTAGAAFGASRGGHAANPTAKSSESTAAPAQNAAPQVTGPQDQQGFEPPSASTAPPQGMSGGS